MKVSEAILRYLVENGVRDIYGIPSGTLAHLTDSMLDINEITYIATKNEAAASYSACKYAKVSQRLGVCAVSGSVGVGNAINGIVEAAVSYAPILILSGAVHQSQKGAGAIQDVDSKKYLKEIVKYTVTISNEKQVIMELKKAMQIAMTHPRGPVNVEIPVNIQGEEFTGEYMEYEAPRELVPDYENLSKTVKLIDDTEKGLIMVGGGCRGLGESIKELAEKLNWRLVTTHTAKGIIKDDFHLSMGHFGFPGTDMAIDYINNGDYECVLVLGSCLGEMASGNYNKNLAQKKIIHIHRDMNVFNRAYTASISICDDLEFAINYLKDKVKSKDLNNDIKAPLNKPHAENNLALSLRTLYENIYKYMPRDTFYMNDIGETLVFAHKYLFIPEEGDYECNVNYGCMGSSVGAMGISRIDTNRQIAVFVGDGSFYMSIMSELLTAKKYNMKIAYFVINNSNLGFVNRGLKTAFGRTMDVFRDEYTDIAATVQAMGIRAIKIQHNSQLADIKEFVLQSDGPCVIEIITDSSESIALDRGEIIINRN